MLKPRITKVEIETFTYELFDLERGEHGPTSSPGKSITNTAHAITISTDIHVSGEYVWSGPIEYAGACVVAELLIGQDPLEREYIYSRIKQTMRQQAEIGISAVDIALWDLAGKYHDAPIHQLLGGYRKTLPTYPASVHATEHDELKSPSEMADFAEQCKEMGYPAFKIHGWENGEPRREAETILAVRDRVGSGMDLMSDPYNALRTFGDAVKVGRACDEAGYFWYEDPLADGGISQFAHRKLQGIAEHPDAPHRARSWTGGEGRLHGQRSHRLRPRRRAVHGHHRNDEARPRRRGPRPGYRDAQPRAGPTPVHGRHSKHQLL